MSKYLKEFGWEPVILTVKNGSYPSVDKSLLEEIPEALKVFKTKTIEPFRIYNKLTGKKGNSNSVGLIGLDKKKGFIQKISFFMRANLFVPDARVGWQPFAYRKAKRIIRYESIEAIITTGPPHSTHLIGLKLKRKYQVPWLADMRDPWTNIFYNKSLPRTSHTIKRDKKLENKVLKSADCITAVSPGLKKEFEKRNENINVIFNGFDEEDIPESTHQKSSKFTLSYIGNLKPNQNIQKLWEAIKDLSDTVPGFSDNFMLSLTGNYDERIENDLIHFEISELTKTNSFVSHSQAIRLMDQSSLLLFIIPQAENNELIITGKIFEYIASRSPILSIGPVNGDASKILADAGRDEMLDYSDKEGIKKNILFYYNKWLENAYYNFKHTSKDFKKYSRRGASENLTKILNQIVK